MKSDNNPTPGELVILISGIPELISGLPMEDRNAIVDAAKSPILLVGYDDDGRAELNFRDTSGAEHFIYVQPSQIRAMEH
jgi:hypothetical protein